MTESGTSRAADVLTAERETWGTEPATAALDAFLGLDHRVKVIVTAWQLRGDPDSGVVNDHSDADYDRDVLERLAASTRMR